MSNYLHTTKAGTSRRRARSITINNPAQPVVPPEPDSAEAKALPTPSITFVMEDRVIMADGSEEFVPAGNLIINLDEAALSKKYSSIDPDTGAIDDTKQRYGSEIMQLIVDALEDVFITEGMARDAVISQ
jgi:hypothetical protein